MLRVIAFLDVLGFRQLAEAVPQAELVDIYNRLLQTIHDGTSADVYPADQRRFQDEPQYSAEEISSRRTVNVVTASDSIIVFSSGAEWTDALQVLTTVRILLNEGFRLGLALRGAVTVGELDAIEGDHTPEAEGQFLAQFRGLVGLGLIRAYELEGTCEWSGAILHEDLVDHFHGIVLERFEDGDGTAWTLIRASRLAVLTHVPVKTRPAEGPAVVADESRWAVPWPLFNGGIFPDLSEAQVAASFSSFGRGSTNASVDAKRENTLRFMRTAAQDANAVPLTADP